MTAGWWDAPIVFRDLAEAISTTTFKVWKNNIGKEGIKDFFKGGESKKGGLFEKVGDKYPLRTMNGSLLIFYLFFIRDLNILIEILKI